MQTTTRSEGLNALATAAALTALALSAVTASGGSPPEDLAQTVTFTNPSPGVGDEFGFSVAVDGDVAVAGARFDDAQGANNGAAFIFRYDTDNGTWAFAQALYANDIIQSGDGYGWSVGASGERIIVGAPFHDHIGTDGGAAYIYRFNGAVWDFEGELLPQVGPTLNNLGWTVAIDGDVAVAGAPNDNLPVSQAGSVYVFRFDGAAWQFEQEITPAGINAGDRFGTSVAVSGDVIIAGAESDDGPGEDLAGCGAAYVYRYDPDTTSWVLEQKLFAPDAAPSDQFGIGSDIDGDVAVIGAWRDQDAGFETGSAYVFRRDPGSGWQFEQKLLAFPPEPNAVSGLDVAVSGNLVVIGSSRADFATQDSGAAFVYQYEGANWTPVARLVHSNPQPGDQLGWSVDVSADVAIVGARLDNQPATDTGQAHVYNLSDCNANGLPDSLDIAQGTSLDNDDDLLPDECEPDCNHNGTLDVEEIADNPGLDYNLDGLPDVCLPPFAVDALWVNGAGGRFREYFNWEPDTPVAGNTARFDLDAAYTVDFDASALTARLVVLSGDVTFDLNGAGAGCNDYELGSLDPAGAILVGGLPGSSAFLTVTGCGELSAPLGGASRIGSGSGASGSLTVTGFLTSLFAGQNTCIGCAGGSGQLNILEGASATTFIGTIGELPGGSGSALVSGPGSTWDVAFFMVVGSGTLTVEDEAVVTVGPGGILVLPDGAILGNGTIEGDVTSVGGLFPGQSPGLLLIDGDYTQAPTPIPPFDEASGSLVVEIAGPTPEIEHDVLQVSGVADLGGGLFVKVTAPFEPGPDQSFTFLNATAITGAFDVAFMPGLESDRFMRVLYAGAPAGSQSASIVVDDLASLFGFDPADPIDVNGLPTDVAVGDLDSDGDQDVAVTLLGATPNDSGSVLVLRNGGFDQDGNWIIEGTTQHAVGLQPSAIALGLLDADGHLDAAVTNAGSDSVSVLVNSGAGDASFDPPVDFPVGAQPQDLAAGNFNGDTFPDLLVANGGADTLLVLGNDGSAGFTQVLANLFTGPSSIAVDPSDLDNDKDADVVAAAAGFGQLFTFRNLGGGVFAAPVTVSVGAGPVDLVAADLDENAFIDLVTANNGDGTVSVVLNNGDGTFAPAVNLPVGDLPRSLTPIDLEGDADIDVAVVANGELEQAVVRVLRNDLSSGQLIFADAAELAAGEDPALVTAGDLDDDPEGLEELITVSASVLSAARSAGAEPASSLRVRRNASNQPTCPQDCGDRDAAVGIVDFLSLLGQWGAVGGTCDLDGAGVGITDFLDLLAHWGPCSAQVKLTRTLFWLAAVPRPANMEAWPHGVAASR